MKRNKGLPEGWTEERVRAIIEHYDNQTDEEALAELEAALNDPDYCMVQVPRALVQRVIEMIQEYEDSRESPKPKKARRSA